MLRVDGVRYDFRSLVCDAHRRRTQLPALCSVTVMRGATGDEDAVLDLARICGDAPWRVWCQHRMRQAWRSAREEDVWLTVHHRDHPHVVMRLGEALYQHARRGTSAQVRFVMGESRATIRLDQSMWEYICSAEEPSGETPQRHHHRGVGRPRRLTPPPNDPYAAEWVIRVARPSEAVRLGRVRELSSSSSSSASSSSFLLGLFLILLVLGVALWVMKQRQQQQRPQQ